MPTTELRGKHGVNTATIHQCRSKQQSQRHSAAASIAGRIFVSITS